MTTRQPSQTEREARAVGAEAAEHVLRTQILAGMPADRIDQSADYVLAGGSEQSTPISRAFYDGYGKVALTYAAAARAFGLDRKAGWHGHVDVVLRDDASHIELEAGG